MKARTITVTGGFSGSVVVDLTDSLQQLATSTFRLALCPVGQDDPPVVDSPTWKTATGSQAAGAASVSALIDGTTAVGHYNIAYDIVTDGRHEAGWALDRSFKRRRALVVVT